MRSFLVNAFPFVPLAFVRVELEEKDGKFCSKRGKCVSLFEEPGDFYKFFLPYYVFLFFFFFYLALIGMESLPTSLASLLLGFLVGVGVLFCPCSFWGKFSLVLSLVGLSCLLHVKAGVSLPLLYEFFYGVAEGFIAFRCFKLSKSRIYRILEEGSFRGYWAVEVSKSIGV